MKEKILDINIRKVEKQDIEQLVNLCADHAQFEESTYNSEGKEESLTKHLFSTISSLQCFVVEVNKELIGYTTFMKQFSTWDVSFYVYMDCLYLKPEARSMGIGQKLMHHITSYAKSEGCQEIQWQTPASNNKAIKFYHRQGALSKSKERFFIDLGVKSK